jgi:cell division protein FtsQ
MTPSHTKRRRTRRWVLVSVIAVVVLGALGFGAYAVLHSRYFAATRIIIGGEHHETAAQIAKVAGLSGAPPMLSVNAGAIQQELAAAFPWIESVSVTSSWPHTVDVRVTERTPVATIQTHAGTLVLVDVTGRRLGPAAAHAALPRLEYALPAGDPAAGALPATAVPGLQVASTLPRAFAAQVAVVQVGTDGWVTLHLTTPVTFILGPATDLSAKYEDVAAVIARTTLHVGDVVDVSVPQAMTVTGP